jgi:DNA helicase HerA-like ATPase
VVLEEAHTVIPEWNFIGAEDKGAHALVNAIGQIALQGRKYGVGFMVIAQRTANVSKTVLTQCNTIVAFQQFDRTSGEFLSNYMGKEMVEALPMLRPRNAIAVGKAFRSGLPVIFRVPDIVEPDPPQPRDQAPDPGLVGDAA